MSSAFAQIEAAVERLRAGGVVAFPTETVYGLGADALNAAAVGRVYELKGRPARNPLIVHVSGPEMARRVVSEWPDEAAMLAREFWPGPLSIILPRKTGKGAVPEIVTGGGPTVAVRSPDHAVALSLLFEFGSPLVGPSANRSGEVSPTTAEHVRESFTEDEVLVLDGGPCAGGIESTVVSLGEGGVARVLRPGIISPNEIRRVIGRAVAVGDETNAGRANGALSSPGLMDRHYAPRTRARLFEAADWPREAERAAVGVVVLSRSLIAVERPHVLIRMPGNAAGYAARLYAALREADSVGAKAILIERPPGGSDDPLWEAIGDRLRRATTP